MSRLAFRAVRAASVPALVSCIGILGMPAGAATVEPEANASGACPGIAELEARGYRIGSIEVRQLPIFDEEPGAKHQALYRLADQLHIDTRDSVIESQLLFQAGDTNLATEHCRDRAQPPGSSLHSGTLSSSRQLPRRHGRFRGVRSRGLDDQPRHLIRPE